MAAAAGESERELQLRNYEAGDQLTSLPLGAGEEEAANRCQLRGADGRGGGCERGQTKRRQRERRQVAGSEDEEEAEEEEEGAPSGCGATARSHFSRLDPTRRSLSTPNVASGGSVASASCNRLLLANGRRQQKAAARQKRPTSLVDGATGASQGPAKGAQGQKAGQQQRRRTALGLISFGSSHFRLNSATGCPERPQSGSGWRQWFASSASSVAAAAQSQQQQQQQVAARKSSLLRNLSGLANLRQQQQQQQLAAGNKQQVPLAGQQQQQPSEGK